MARLPAAKAVAVTIQEDDAAAWLLQFLENTMMTTKGRRNERTNSTNERTDFYVLMLVLVVA